MAGALAVAPDPLTAQILAKHAAGEKLTPAEAGKLGAFRARSSTKPNGRPRLNPAPPAPVAPDAPAGPARSIPVENLDGPPLDSALVKDTTRAILNTLSGIAERWAGDEAIKAGADTRTAAEFSKAVALPDGPKQVMVETSPAVAASLGLNPEQTPIAAFLGGLGIWSAQLFLAMKRLETLNKEHHRNAAPKPTTPPAAAAAPAPSTP